MRAASDRDCRATAWSRRNRARRDVEHAARGAQHRGALAARSRPSRGRTTVTVCSARPCADRDRRRRGRCASPARCGWKSAGVAPSRQRRMAGNDAYGIAAAGIEVQRRVEHELGADQAARVVARRVVVVRAQVIRGLVGERAAVGDLEHADLGAAARVAVADDHDGVARDQQSRRTRRPAARRPGRRRRPRRPAAGRGRRSRR